MTGMSANLGSRCHSQGVEDAERLAYWYRRAMLAEYARQPLWVTPEEYHQLVRDMTNHASAYRFMRPQDMGIPAAEVFGTEVRVKPERYRTTGNRVMVHNGDGQWREVEVESVDVMFTPDRDPDVPHFIERLDPATVTRRYWSGVIGLDEARSVLGLPPLSAGVITVDGARVEYTGIDSADEREWAPDLAGGMTIDELLSMEEEWKR